MKKTNESTKKIKSEINITELINLKKFLKSKYILKELFSFLDEKRKLKIIQYNKKYNELLEIDIKQYKDKSGKLKVSEKHGYTRIYDLDKMNLIFEGSYLNGKANGKGKEFSSNGELIFEGEYLNGKKNGKGKEYDSEEENLIFDGNYLNDEKSGKGKEYYNNGKIKFEGEYLKGEIWNGILYDKYSELKYEIKKGKSIINYDNLTFEDEYYSDVSSNDGGLKIKKLKNVKPKGGKKKYNFKEPKLANSITKLKYYEGEFLNNQRNGKGKEYDQSGKIIFEGIYLNDKRKKKLITDIKKKIKNIKPGKNQKLEIPNETFDDIKLRKENLDYSFENPLESYLIKYHSSDEKKDHIAINNSRIKEYQKNDLILENLFSQGKINGNNSFESQESVSFEIKNNVSIISENNFDCQNMEETEMDKLGKVDKYFIGNRNGKGKEIDLDGNLLFEGEYLDGKRNGQGKEYDKNKSYRLIFKGEFINDKRWNGVFIEFGSCDNILFEGEYINGIKEGKEYKNRRLIYEGKYLNNKKNKKGKEYYNFGKLKFEGEYSYGRKWNGNIYDNNGNLSFKIKDGAGNGKEYDDDGWLIYDGEYLDGKRNGKGKEYNYSLIYEGEFFDGKRRGKGKKYY